MRKESLVHPIRRFALKPSDTFEGLAWIAAFGIQVVVVMYERTAVSARGARQLVHALCEARCNCMRNPDVILDE
eukprot:5614528-Pyramimonas_sp.AAC.1